MLEQVAARRRPSGVLLAFSRWDTVDHEDADRVRDYHTTFAADLVGGRPFFLSAKMAMEGHIANDPLVVHRSGVLPLADALKDLHEQKAGKPEFKRSAAKAGQFVHAGLTVLLQREKGLEVFQATLPKLQACGEDLLSRIHHFGRELGREVGCAAMEFFGSLVERYEGWGAEVKVEPFGPLDFLHYDEGIERVRSSVLGGISERALKDANQWWGRVGKPLLTQRADQAEQEIKAKLERLLTLAREALAHGGTSRSGAAGAAKPSPSLDGLSRSVCKIGEDEFNSAVAHIVDARIENRRLNIDAALTAYLQVHLVDGRIRTAVSRAMTTATLENGAKCREEMFRRIATKLSEVERETDEEIARQYHEVLIQARVLSELSSGSSEPQRGLAALRGAREELQAILKELDELADQNTGPAPRPECWVVPRSPPIVGTS